MSAPCRRLSAPVVAALLLAGLARGQSPPPSVEVAWPHDTGARIASGAGPEVVDSFTVFVEGAEWLRLRFDEVVLGGDVFAGRGSVLRVTSHLDGAVQELDAYRAEQWGNDTAFFNGDTVQVDLVAWPGSGPNRLRLATVVAGVPPVVTESQCGPVDDRLPSTDPRSARVLPIGCTGWLIDDCAHCMLTAGHCAGGTGTIQFNVPPSNSNGSIVHPPPEDQYAVDSASLQGIGGGTGNDWAYYGVFPNPNTGLTPFEAQGQTFTLALPPPFNGFESIRITGYGVDDGVRNQVQQTHVGPWVSHSGTTLTYQTDTTGGNSGSPVIHEQSGTAIGIHTHGGCQTSGSGANLGTASNHAGLGAALANPLGVCEAGLRLLDPVPIALDPGATTAVDLSISGSVAPGSATLHFRFDGGAYSTFPLQHAGGNVYGATLPAGDCGQLAEFWFSADITDCGGVRTLPDGAPGTVFDAEVADLVTFHADDMEGLSGWIGGVAGDNATTGIWTRVDPNGTAYQPEDDHTPSPGTMCWVTGQGSVGGSDGTNDVDGGQTTLLSPVFDLSGRVNPHVAYWRWYDTSGDDVLRIAISDDGGATWQPLENLTSGPEGSGGWRHHLARVSDFVAVTSQVRFRVVASDFGTGHFVEAAFDDFELFDVSCPAPLTAYCFCASGPCGNADPGAGCANSTGVGSLLGGAGSLSVAADDLALTAVQVPPNRSGLFFMGSTQISVPFGDGSLCAGAGSTGIFRYNVQDSGPAGELTLGPGIVARSSSFAAPGQIAAGQTWRFQAWFRDPSGPCGSGFNTSNAVSATFVP